MNLYLKPIYITLLACAPMLSGCYTGFESQPYIETNSNWQFKGKRLLVGPDIEVLMKVSNYRTRFYNNDDLGYFGISLWFDPKASGYRFNPQKTSLKFKNQSIYPFDIKFVSSGFNNRSVDWECGRYPWRDFGPGPNYLLFSGACFEFYFSISSLSSNSSFSIKLDGLTLNNASVAVPEIKFKEGSFRAFM